MAFDVNSGGTIKLFTGITDMKVIAINPSLEEATKLGLSMKKEETYTFKDDKDVNCANIDFWLQHPTQDFKLKYRIWLKDIDRLATTGKKLAINDFGQSSFVDTLDKLPVNGDGVQWFSSQGVRWAKVGEDDLIRFLKGWLNIGAGRTAKLDDITKLFKGDFSELRSIMKAAATNNIQVLITIKGGYMQVFPKHFEKGGNVIKTRWEKAVADTVKSGYPVELAGGKITFQEYVMQEGPSAAPANAEGDPFAGASAPDTDLPF